MKRVLILFFLLSTMLFSQNANLPEGISVSNQMKYSYDNLIKREIFENWLNADYRFGNFKAGIRLDVFQPNDPNPAISRGKENFSDISFKYLNYTLGSKKQKVTFTVGNYYSNFGRGLVLKIYEDRNVRVDNNLLGVKINGRWNSLFFTALTGMAENSNAERKDILHAADVEFRGIKNLVSGISFASNQPYITELASTNLISGRFSYKLNNINFYSEYGLKQNSDTKNSIFNNERDFIGRGFYSNINFFVSGFSISAEFKHYDNFKFTSYDGTIIYNTPPSLTKDYSYILLNRHPYALNQNNEQGYQLALSYKINADNKLDVNYGITNTIGRNSFYSSIQNSKNNAEKIFEECFLKYENTLSNLTTVLAFGYKDERTTFIKSLTPILELKYYYNENNTIRAILEHQQNSVSTTSEKYFDDVLTLEWLSSPNLSIALVGEVQTREPELNKIQREYWGFVRLGYNLFENSEISILVGTRQAGNICIGGVCRYEPEFSGIELKLSTRLF